MKPLHLHANHNLKIAVGPCLNQASRHRISQVSVSHRPTHLVSSRHSRHPPSHIPYSVASTTATPSTNNQVELARAVVVGGGPTGLYAAIRLAALGFSVDVYEARSSPMLDKDESISAYSSHSMDSVILTARGLDALRQVDITPPTSSDQQPRGWTPLVASAIHIGTTNLELPLPPSGPQATVISIERLVLARLLFQHAQSKYSDRIRFFFNHHLEYITVDRRRAVFLHKAPRDMHDAVTDPNKVSTTEPEVVKVDYDLLVGADGDHSTVRHCVQDQIESFKMSTSELNLRHLVTRLDCVDSLLKQRNFMQTIHQWIDNADGHVIVQAQPNANGTSMTISVTYPKTLPAEKFFRLFKMRDERLCWLEFFKRFLPTLPTEWHQQLATRLVEDARVKKTKEADGHARRCESFHGPGVVLIGEAAHALGPMLSHQGVSMAFESSVVLAEALRAFNPRHTKGSSVNHALLDKALDSFSAERTDDVAAAVHLSDKLSLIEKKSKDIATANYNYKMINKGTHGTLTDAHKAWHQLVIRMAPWVVAVLVFSSRFLPFFRPVMSRINTTPISYSTALEQMAMEQDKALMVVTLLGFLFLLGLKLLLMYFGIN